MRGVIPAASQPGHGRDSRQRGQHLAVLTYVQWTGVDAG